MLDLWFGEAGVRTRHCRLRARHTFLDTDNHRMQIPIFGRGMERHDVLSLHCALVKMSGLPCFSKRPASSISSEISRIRRASERHFIIAHAGVDAVANLGTNMNPTRWLTDGAFPLPS